MPNTRVPAAGEAMPAAKILTRRTLMGGIASVPAFAGATAAFAASQSPTTETPLARVQRLWGEFCEALEAMTPADCRIEISGSHQHGNVEPALHVMSMRLDYEVFHGRHVIPIEKLVDEWWSRVPGQIVRYES